MFYIFDLLDFDTVVFIYSFSITYFLNNESKFLILMKYIKAQNKFKQKVKFFKIFNFFEISYIFLSIAFIQL